MDEEPQGVPSDDFTNFEAVIHSYSSQLDSLYQNLQGLGNAYVSKFAITLSEEIRAKCEDISWLALSIMLSLAIWQQARLEEDTYNELLWEEIRKRANAITDQLQEIGKTLSSDHNNFKQIFYALLIAYAIIHSTMSDRTCSRCCMAIEWWIFHLVYSGTRKNNLNRVCTHLQVLLLYLCSGFVEDVGSSRSRWQSESADARYCLSLSSLVTKTVFSDADGRKYPVQVSFTPAANQNEHRYGASIPSKLDISVAAIDADKEVDLALAPGPADLETLENDDASETLLDTHNCQNTIADDLNTHRHASNAAIAEHKSSLPVTLIAQNLAIIPYEGKLCLAIVPAIGVENSLPSMPTSLTSISQQSMEIPRDQKQCIVGTTQDIALEEQLTDEKLSYLAPDNQPDKIKDLSLDFNPETSQAGSKRSAEMVSCEGLRHCVIIPKGSDQRQFLELVDKSRHVATSSELALTEDGFISTNTTLDAALADEYQFIDAFQNATIDREDKQLLFE